MGLERSQNVEGCAIGEVVVGNDDVRAGVRELLPRLGNAGRREDDGVWVIAGERAAQDEPQDGVVVDDEKGRLGHNKVTFNR